MDSKQTQLACSSVLNINQTLRPQLYLQGSGSISPRGVVSMNDLEKSLGEAITVKELSEYLGINQKTLRENYRQFGGIRIGRHYRFFTKEVANALEKRQEQIYSASQEERSAEREGLPDTEGSEGVGSQDEKAVRRRVERQDDKHGLLD